MTIVQLWLRALSANPAGRVREVSPFGSIRRDTFSGVATASMLLPSAVKRAHAISSAGSAEAIGTQSKKQNNSDARNIVYYAACVVALFPPPAALWQVVDDAGGDGDDLRSPTNQTPWPAASSVSAEATASCSTA